MKKFLFTLAALMMAGSAFAANVYIPDTEFTAEQIGTQVWLPLYVELDNEYMNGWDMTFTYPENLTVTASIRKNNAVLTQTAVTDEFGTEENVAFTVNGNSTQNIGACIQGGYWDPDGDGEYEMYGACKIGPTGTFMLYEIRVKPEEGFTGGEILIDWMVSGGFDERNGQESMQVKGNTTVALTVASSQPEQADMPIITFDPDNSGVMISIENYTEYTITVNDVQVDPTRDGEHYYYVEKEYDLAKHIVVYAKNAPADMLPAEDTKEYDLAAKDKDVNSTPSVTYSYDPETGELNVWAYGCTEDDVEYTLYCDGVEYTGEMPITVDPYEGYNHTWTATAVSPTTTVSAESAPCEVVIAALPKVYQTPDPEIVVVDDPEAQTVTITVTGEGAIHVDVVGAVVNEHKDGTDEVVIVIPYGDEVDFVNIHATAVAPLPEGYDEVAGGEATEEFVEIPKKEVTPTQEQVKQVTYSTREGHVDEDTPAVFVTLECATEGATIYYTFDDPEDPEAEWLIYDGEFSVTTEGKTVIYTYAAKDGMDDSEMNFFSFIIDENTGLNELLNGKTVAGVRYFNMAGQEMSKVEGMTIVVTTYTDGTTSAVKVIK